MAKRRQRVTVIEEHRRDSGYCYGITIRLRSGEEWVVGPDELGPSAIEQMVLKKAAKRSSVIQLLRALTADGMSYEYARRTVAKQLELSEKSVGRYWHAWKKMNAPDQRPAE